MNQYCFIFQGITYFIWEKYLVLRDYPGEEGSKSYFSLHADDIQRKRKKPKFSVKQEFLYLAMLTNASLSNLCSLDMACQWKYVLQNNAIFASLEMSKYFKQSSIREKQTEKNDSISHRQPLVLFLLYFDLFSLFKKLC